MRRLSPDASSPWSVGRSDERCERNVHSTYFHTKPSVSECSHGPRYHLRPLFHLYITHISQSHDPRNRLPQGSDRATNTTSPRSAQPAPAVVAARRTPVLDCTVLSLRPPASTLSGRADNPRAARLGTLRPAAFVGASLLPRGSIPRRPCAKSNFEGRRSNGCCHARCK